MTQFSVTYQIPRKRVYDTVISGVESGGFGSFMVNSQRWKEAWQAAERGEENAFGACPFRVKYEEDWDTYPAQPLSDVLLQAGLDFMAQNFPKALSDIVTENDDAITGDILLQCSLLGDVVYG